MDNKTYVSNKHERTRPNSLRTQFQEAQQEIEIVFGMRWVHKAKSGRPNHRKPEGRILLTIRPNRKAQLDHMAENISSLISA